MTKQFEIEDFIDEYDVSLNNFKCVKFVNDACCRFLKVSNAHGKELLEKEK